MQLVFIDETVQGDTFCISMVIINSTKYTKIKSEYLEILEKYGWDHKKDGNEFKGRAIFSANYPEGNKVSVENRIQMCNEILSRALTPRGQKRISVTFFSCDLRGRDRKEIYFNVVPKLLEKNLEKRSKRGGKNCVAIFCDNFEVKKNDDLYQEMRKTIATIIREKGFVFFEEIFFCNSTNYTIGINYADIIGYLKAKQEFGEVRNQIKVENLDALLENYKKIEKFRIIVHLPTGKCG